MALLPINVGALAIALKLLKSKLVNINKDVVMGASSKTKTIWRRARIKQKKLKAKRKDAIGNIIVKGKAIAQTFEGVIDNHTPHEMELYTKTPLGAAIMKALSKLNEDIVEAIKGAKPGSCKAYVFGGAALHMYTNARGSSDIDVELEAVEKLQVEEIIVLYLDESGDEQSVEIDTNFSTGISGMLAEDYRDSAVPLMASNDEPLHVFLVSPIHLAVHKLDRLATDDQNDIISLAKAEKITSQELYDTGMEVLPYAVGDENRLNGNVVFMFNRLVKLGY